MAAQAKKGLPAPKRGKARAVMKSNVKKKPASAYQDVPYVRHGRATVKSRPERSSWEMTLTSLMAASESELIAMLLKDGFLVDLEGTECSSCQLAKLGKLQDYAGKGLRHRCKAKSCQRYVLPYADHPIFSTGTGKGAAALKPQANVLFCAVAGVPASTRHVLTGCSHKLIEAIYARLDDARKRFVEREEGNIVYGKGKAWKDVEADEVDVRRRDLGVSEGDGKNTVVWEQWAGVVKRGSARTLMLFRLNPKRATRRAPGPGPIRKEEWRNFAQKHLKGRRVVLHTDGARSYQLRVAGVLHDHVVHMKKRCVSADGEATWISPKFVKVFTHELPEGGRVDVKGGTQVIDRFWEHLRAHLKHRASPPGSEALERRIRSAQWTYWNKGEDLWAKTGEMLTALREV